MSGSSLPARARDVRSMAYADSGSRAEADPSSPAPASAGAASSDSVSPVMRGTLEIPCEMKLRMSSRVTPCASSTSAA